MAAGRVKIWLEACRLRTLPLSLSCVLMGSFLAYAEGSFDWRVFLLSVLTTVLLQILSNLANDYGDSIHGADGKHRQGPSRAVQSGAISKSDMRRAVLLVAGLSFASGLALLRLAFRGQAAYLMIFLALGLAAIYAAISYTAGDKPYGYRGLGDVSVLVFFGLVGVGGTYFIQAASMDYSILLPALSCGLFAAGVLNVNNIRDIESDRKAGKISTAVRLGRDRAVVYHCVLLVVGLAAAAVHVLLNFRGAFQWLFLLTAPLFITNARAVITNTTASSLDPYLRQLVISTLLFVMTFGVGLLLALSSY